LPENKEIRMSRGEAPPIPSHIPSALVVDFDANDGRQLGEDPLESLAGLHDNPEWTLKIPEFQVPRRRRIIMPRRDRVVAH
jgi:hypothetical protein